MSPDTFPRVAQVGCGMRASLSATRRGNRERADAPLIQVAPSDSPSTCVAPTIEEALAPTYVEMHVEDCRKGPNNPVTSGRCVSKATKTLQSRCDPGQHEDEHPAEIRAETRALQGVECQEATAAQRSQQQDMPEQNYAVSAANTNLNAAAVCRTCTTHRHTQTQAKVKYKFNLSHMQPRYVSKCPTAVEIAGIGLTMKLRRHYASAIEYAECQCALSLFRKTR